MSMERWIRLIADSFILISLALAYWVNSSWIWFAAFVGANLIQSSITRRCLMGDIFNRMGLVKKSCCQGDGGR
jgi:hypothetical protein